MQSDPETKTSTLTLTRDVPLLAFDDYPEKNQAEISAFYAQKTKRREAVVKAILALTKKVKVEILPDEGRVQKALSEWSPGNSVNNPTREQIRLDFPRFLVALTHSPDAEKVLSPEDVKNAPDYYLDSRPFTPAAACDEFNFSQLGTFEN